jgi:hypothetical protein
MVIYLSSGESECATSGRHRDGNRIYCLGCSISYDEKRYPSEDCDRICPHFNNSDFGTDDRSTVLTHKGG